MGRCARTIRARGSAAHQSRFVDGDDRLRPVVLAAWAAAALLADGLLLRLRDA